MSKRLPKHLYRFHADTIDSVTSELKRCIQTLIRSGAKQAAAQLAVAVVLADRTVGRLRKKALRAPRRGL